MNSKVKVKLKTITPLHIGSGNNYSAVEFLIDKEKKILKRFSIEDITHTAEELGKLQQFASFFKNTEFKSLSELMKYNYLKEIVDNTKPLYSIKTELLEDKEVEEFIKVNNQIYIPGSELKGSLRRAIILYVLQKDEKLLKWLVSELEKLMKLKLELERLMKLESEKLIRLELEKLIESESEKFIKSKLEKVIESENPIKKELEKLIKKEKKAFKKETKYLERKLEEKIFQANINVGKAQPPQKDIMRLIRFEDSKLVEVTEKNLKVKKIEVRYTNNKNVRNTFFSETVTPGTEFLLSITIPIKEFKYSVERLHNKVLKETFSNLNSSKEIVSKLFEIWIEVEKENIKIDKDLIPVEEDEILNSNNLERAKKVLSFQKKLKSGKLSLIRVGKHEGFLFTTVAPILKKKHPKLFKNLFNMAAPKPRNIPNKTRKVTASDKLPLGFCKIEVLECQ